MCHREDSRVNGGKVAQSVQRVRTHYDNLKVSRDAPIEVIRAAYKSLAAKYHPDLNPGSDRAQRVMQIVARSYGVLSDPVARAEHDRWIVGVEANPDEVQKPTPQRVGVRISVPQSLRVWKERFPKWVGSIGTLPLSILIVGVMAFVLIGVFPQVPLNNPPATVQVQAPPFDPKTTTVVRSEDRRVRQDPPKQQRLIYSRPALDSYGQPWPVTSAYIIEPESQTGNSVAMVDNAQNSSDMLVKLFDRAFRPPRASRVFFLRAHEQFSIERVSPGDYDIRFKNLDSGVIRKSEPFTLTESVEDIQEPDGVLHKTRRSK